jgi:hypothetical protein
VVHETNVEPRETSICNESDQLICASAAMLEN